MAAFDAFEILFRELAVIGKTRDAEVPAAVLGLVGDVLRGEILDERDHLGDVVGGVGYDFGSFDVERGHVLEEGVFEALGVDADGLVGERGVADDLVIHIGDVHDVADVEAELAQGAAEEIDVEEGAEVADVAEVVDGGAAGVHAEGPAVGGGEGFDAAGEGVEEFHGLCRL